MMKVLITAAIMVPISSQSENLSTNSMRKNWLNWGLPIIVSAKNAKKLNLNPAKKTKMSFPMDAAPDIVMNFQPMKSKQNLPLIPPM